MIEIENLTKKFGDLTAVDNLNLRIEAGEVFGLLGPNGSGKTTTVRMLCCLISKTSGKVEINDLSLDNKSDHTAIRKIIGLLPENVGLFEDQTAYKNLDFYGKLYDMPKNLRKTQIDYFLKMLGLWEKRDALAGTLSKGMKQKLAIARALIHDPQILFLDEPTANLDPEAAKIVRDTLLELKKEKRTIFLNTHLLDEAERICDRVGILNTRLIDIGTPDKLRQSLGGKKSVVELETITDSIIDTLKNIGLKYIEVRGNQMIIDVTDPRKDNPRIIKAIESAGGLIQSISAIVPTLEDVYLKEVKRNEKK